MTRYTVIGKRNERSAMPKKYERWQRTLQRRSLDDNVGNWGTSGGGVAPMSEACSDVIVFGC
jgi:hypothetical protein